jgi:hypothetical protein
MPEVATTAAEPVAARKPTRADVSHSTAVEPAQLARDRMRRWMRAIVLLCVVMIGVGAVAGTMLFRAGYTPAVLLPNAEVAPTAPEEPPPSWAMFNGKDLNGWHTRPGEPRARWFVGNVSIHKKDPTRLYAGPSKTGETGERAMSNLNTRSDAYSEQHVGGGTLDVEFLIPKSAAAGIYLMGEYAIKIADGPVKEGADETGVAARVNAARRAGDWQRLVAEYRAPRFEAAQKVANFRIVHLTLNGQVLHEHLELAAPSPAGLTGREAAVGPVLLQGTTGPIAIRSIRFTPRPGA